MLPAAQRYDSMSIRQFGNLQIVVTDLFRLREEDELFDGADDSTESFQVTINWFGRSAATGLPINITLAECRGMSKLNALHKSATQARKTLRIYAEVHNSLPYLARQRVRDVRVLFSRAHIYKDKYLACADDPVSAFGWKKLAVSQILAYLKLTKRPLNARMFVESRLRFPMELKQWR